MTAHAINAPWPVAVIELGRARGGKSPLLAAPRELLHRIRAAAMEMVEVRFTGSLSPAHRSLIEALKSYAVKLSDSGGPVLRFAAIIETQTLSSGLAQWLASQGITAQYDWYGSLPEPLRTGELLTECGVDQRVRLVAEPDSAKDATALLSRIQRLGISDIVLTHALGVHWAPRPALAYLAAVAALRRPGEPAPTARWEPGLVVPRLSLGADGSLYVGCATQLPPIFAPLVEALRAGDAGKEVDPTWPGAEELYERILSAAGYLEEAQLIFNNLYLDVRAARRAGLAQVSLHPHRPQPVTEIQLTHQCQLACRYCQLDRSRPDMDRATLQQAIDFACTTSNQRVVVQFFGGEPLLRFSLMEEGAQRAMDRCGERGKQLKLSVATNGILLDASRRQWVLHRGALLIFSLDGQRASHLRNRPPLGSPEGGDDKLYDRIVENLSAIREDGIEFFVNLVVAPDNLDMLTEDVCFVVHDLQVDVLRLSYQLGHEWTTGQRALFLAKMQEILPRLESIARESGRAVRLLNFEADDEPTMAAASLNIDSNGDVFAGCTLAVVDSLPGLQRINHRGTIASLSSLDDIDVSIDSQFFRLAEGNLRLAEQRILWNNLSFGVEVKRFFDASKSELRKTLDSDER